jgi:hypothetical protein
MDINFLTCKVTHDRLSQIDRSSDLTALEKAFEINDDLLQGEYKNGLVVDVGWFNLESISNVGGPYRLPCFLVRLIRAADWTTPSVQFVARNFTELDEALLSVERWAVKLQD